MFCFQTVLVIFAVALLVVGTAGLIITLIFEMVSFLIFAFGELI